MISKADIDENTRLCSFDISHMYTNIPQKDVIDIIKTSTLIDEKEVILPIIHIILNQNYFQHNQNCINKHKALPWELLPHLY
jgi:hypothetical protein